MLLRDSCNGGAREVLQAVTRRTRPMLTEMHIQQTRGMVQ
jgi:hypothetical protein